MEFFIISSNSFLILCLVYKMLPDSSSLAKSVKISFKVLLFSESSNLLISGFKVLLPDCASKSDNTFLGFQLPLVKVLVIPFIVCICFEN